MFEPTPALQRLIDHLYRATLGLNRGDVLAHAVIASILGVDPHDGQWDHCVDRVRKRIEQERGIATWADHGIGYRLCTEDEQLDIPRRRQVRARRQVRKGLGSIIALPVDGLTIHQQRARSLRIEQMRRLDYDITSELRVDEAIMARQESLPRVRPRG